MRKIQWVAAISAISLALPFTILALGGIAFIDEHLGEIHSLTQLVDQFTTVGGRGWVAVLSERLPELAGMIIGQLVILTILLLARQAKNQPPTQ